MKLIIDPLKDVEIVWSVDGEYLRPMYAVDNLRRTKTGKWEPFNTADRHYVKCGNCGEICFDYYKNFPYCPLCGAKMDGSDKND